MRDHLDAFRAEAGRLRDGEGLPRFVEQEFRNFLTCGCLAGGFARFHCDCGLIRLVAFSCEGRGFCARCGGRRAPTRTRAESARRGVGVSPVRGTAAADCPHRGGGCDRPDSAASRPADGGAPAASSPRAAARVGRGRPRARTDGLGRWPRRVAARFVSHRPAGECPIRDSAAEVCRASL